MAKKTRFAVVANGQNSELFSVRERTNGDLVLIFKRSSEMGDGLRNVYAAAEEHRVSVHVSPASAGNTVIQHIRTADGLYQKAACWMRLRRKRLVWPLLACGTEDISASHFNLEANQNDEVITICTYTPRISVLCYFIVISNVETNVKIPLKLNHIRTTFRRFAINLLWGFIPSVSFHQGEYFFMSTAISLEKDGKTIARTRWAEDAQSMTIKQLTATVANMGHRLIAAHEFKVLRYLNASGMTLNNEAIELGRMLIRDPIQPSNDGGG